MAGSDRIVADAERLRLLQVVVGFVMMNDVMPFVPFFGSVTAVTTKISPTPPCVMKRFEPFTT